MFILLTNNYHSVDYCTSLYTLLTHWFGSTYRHIYVVNIARKLSLSKLINLYTVLKSLYF